MVLGFLFFVTPPTTPVFAAPPTSQPVEGPITYYNNNCNRCHGQVDNAYADSHNPPKGEALKKIIQEMAEGPAQAPLDEAGLAEQVKLHEAIFGGGPYVWMPLKLVTTPYETIPGTRIVFATERGDQPVKVTDDGKFFLPAGRGMFKAERNDKTFLKQISTTGTTQPANH
jgi:hypothetical protein